MKRGKLYYDSEINRPYIAFCDGTYSEPIHCGELVYLPLGGQMQAARLELDPDDAWYYAGLERKRLITPGDIVYRCD